MLKASVIISVYKDVQALNSILYALSMQSEPNFEVVVAEDGDSKDVADYLNSLPFPNLNIVHVTQEDLGWRKMTAVNKAVAKAKSDYLIFLDGDCIPHFKHVECHIKHSEPGKTLIGRRVFLGRRYSNLVRTEPQEIGPLQKPIYYLSKIFSLHQDKVRNYEVGFINPLLHALYKKKWLNLVGCNFSCFLADFKTVNGYNEELPGAGAEDDDLCHRMMAMGIKMKNIKFLTPVYHLDHPVRRALADENARITAKNLKNGVYYCKKGLDQHL
ncbi:glycosyltransferase [Vibrio coralliilyticus]|jgi:predicted glycosyltransferase involved in capsule biosynthesis|uniref:glycosyltransferase n=1 Tax=Vibrio coralliilyticus TaxID=190893 RepID=UPI00148C35D2|nr:glycosyltransferase [Vibrio coralliilyticus]NOI30733.1 glycosyltransferase [Vibrio coralliilyticus]NOI49720.1 glycosyltransferase [Vibrio coralliilyticus]